MAMAQASTRAVTARAQARAPAQGRARAAAAPAPSFGAESASFHTWNPHNNKFFETFSYLPPLDDDALMRQIDYMIRNAWVPCIEFEDAERAFTDSHGRINSLDSSVQSGYYDNRLWPMWKLPMFGSTQSSQVLQEINNCKEANPNCFIRLVGFDPNTQVQITSFLVYKPASKTQDVFRNVDDRQIKGA